MIVKLDKLPDISISIYPKEIISLSSAKYYRYLEYRINVEFDKYGINRFDEYILCNDILYRIEINRSCESLNDTITFSVSYIEMTYKDIVELYIKEVT